MKVTIIPIVIGTLGTDIGGLIKGLEDLELRRRVDAIQTTELLRSARIQRRMLETWGDLLSLKIQWKPSANAYMKNSKGVNTTTTTINNNNNNNNNNNLPTQATEQQLLFLNKERKRNKLILPDFPREGKNYRKSSPKRKAKYLKLYEQVLRFYYSKKGMIFLFLFLLTFSFYFYFYLCILIVSLEATQQMYASV